MTFQTNSDELDYLSTATGGFSLRADINRDDERDKPALDFVLAMLDDDIQSYSSIDRLELGEAEFTIKEQLAINKSIQHHLRTYKMTIEKALEDIREKYNG